MSLINKVLQDLDHRNAGAGEAPASPKVKAVGGKAGGHEWFWRTVAGLVAIALGWVGWVVYQIQPQPIATDLALAAAQARAATPPPAAKAVVAEAPKPAIASPPAVAAAPKLAEPPPPAVAKPEAEKKPVAAPQRTVAPESLRFSYSIETPIGARSPKAAPAKHPAARAEQKTVAQLAAPADRKSRVERRDRELTGSERADTEFRRGVELLKRGRATEAEALFAVALKSDVGHRGARQALVALKLERNELDDAARLLREGLAVDPAQPDFVVALARIHVERGQFPAALEVLDSSASIAGNHVEYHVLRGTVLRSLGRHEQAAVAYRSALTMQASVPAWMGLGISLEALQQRTAAADAFRNALALGPVSGELRTFAEQRIQALR